MAVEFEQMNIKMEKQLADKIRRIVLEINSAHRERYRKTNGDIIKMAIEALERELAAQEKPAESEVKLDI